MVKVISADGQQEQSASRRHRYHQRQKKVQPPPFPPGWLAGHGAFAGHWAFARHRTLSRGFINRRVVFITQRGQNETLKPFLGADIVSVR